RNARPARAERKPRPARATATGGATRVDRPGPHTPQQARPTRPGSAESHPDPAESAGDDRTRGRRAATLGTRPATPPGTTAGPPATPAPPYVRGTRLPPPRARHLLPPEVMLFATGRHRAARDLEPELAALCRMCQIPTSLAEASAYLLRSLDDTRALVRRGVDAGLLGADVPELGLAGRPPLALLHRVHQGLLRR
ncbi:DUF742 domain-containing protein, partial [Amycolatopsis sp. CA-128772]|uniref:DUF742 domain-containing protein n=1 Tax=Amycolatopsis sp. CA-128772 TaxID=2073159 RepID=UPI0011B0EC42